MTAMRVLTGRLFPVLLLTLCMGGCTSVPMPKGTSKGYSTARFINPIRAVDEVETARESATHRMIHEAVTAQMESHNVKVVKQGSSDLIIAYLLMVQDNFSTTSMDEYYGYRNDATDILDKAHKDGLSGKQLERFKRGALVIDLIDAKTGKLVYRDFSVRGVSSSDSDEVRQTRINEATAEALQKFFN